MVQDRSGVAAVEFAFILPLLLLLYVGANTLMQAISATRAVTVLTRTIADLTSQQPANNNLSDAVVQDIFNASTAVLAPFPTTNLKMTLSNVEFVANAASTGSNGFDAKTRWTVSFTGGTLRPCLGNPKLTPVPNGTDPSATTLPVGLYAAGFIIVADVSYTYIPTVGLFTWANANGQVGGTIIPIRMRRTAYMRPRQTDNIRYSPSSSSTTATVCPIASPQVS